MSGSAVAGLRSPFIPLLVCLVAGLLISFIAVPPWQNPDEPQHMMTVRLIMRHGPDFVLDRDVDPASEREIVESMAAHDWWRHYGDPTPEPVPQTFADGPARTTSSYFGPPGGGSRLYYRAMAAVFERMSVDGLLSQLYVMRLVSALATIAAFWSMWSGTRVLLGDRPAIAISALVALHPQFAFVSTAASPDAVVNMAGAIVWRQSAILLATGASVADLGALWVAGIGAFAVRRMGAPLLAIAGAVTAIVIAREFVRKGASRAAIVGGLSAAAAVATIGAVLAADLSRAFTWIQFDLRQSLAATVERSEGLPAFFDMFYRTFWLSAGWLRHPAPEWWHIVTVALSAVSIAGLVTLAWSRPRDSGLWLAAAAVAVQIAAVVAYYFGIVQSGPQGRYLFPVLPAIFCLVWLGWHSVVGTQLRPELAAASLVTVMAFLNASAWVFVVLPAYL